MRKAGKNGRMLPIVWERVNGGSKRRDVQAGPLPGKSLVIYEPAHGLVSDVFRRIQVKLDQVTRDGNRLLYLVTNVPPRKASHISTAKILRNRKVNAEAP